MAETANDLIEKLRKKSQTLLARVEENSKRVNIEIRKLRSQTLSLANYQNEESNYIRRNTNLWELRNNSSGVGAILCPDYFYCSPELKSASVSEMIPSKKLTLISTKAHESHMNEAHCSRIPPRKPVKGCYCHLGVNTSSKLSNAQPTPLFRQHRSQPEFTYIKETEEKATLSSPISCETFRRVQKINYIPQSQFLRNVQNKICELQTGGQGDCLQRCPRSTNYHRFMASARMQNVIPDKKTTLSNECNSVEKRQKPPASLRAPANSIASEQSKSDRSGHIHILSGENLASSRKQLKSTLRKTINSRRERIESSQEPLAKPSTENKRTTQLSKSNCYCCYKDTLSDKRGKKQDLLEYHERMCQCLKRDDNPVIDNSTDQIMEDLKVFREKNYFETHGSHLTLASSRSSDSLQQYLLNERLFPEPMRRIHRKDLVVTMPPCATAQKKRIHYFPRHVVRQEKSACNTNYKRKRRQSCPLTGHAIDLGVLKAKPPLNSLALKYQKRAV